MQKKIDSGWYIFGILHHGENENVTVIFFWVIHILCKADLCFLEGDVGG